jgi:FecR protein
LPRPAAHASVALRRTTIDQRLERTRLATRRDTLAGAGGFLLLAGRDVAAAADGVGRVERASGRLAAVRGPGIVGLAVGDAVFVDDILRTGADSRALIVCADGLQIAIGPGTELALRSFVTEAVGGGGGVRAVLGLLQGITRLIGGLVEGGGGRAVEVDTRTAVASVRSTEWLVESTAKGTGVLAIVGEVAVAALAGGTVTLRPGEGTDVAPGAPPRAPATWGDARRRDAIARTTV